MIINITYLFLGLIILNLAVYLYLSFTTETNILKLTVVMLIVLSLIGCVYYSLYRVDDVDKFTVIDGETKNWYLDKCEITDTKVIQNNGLEIAINAVGLNKGQNKYLEAEEDIDKPVFLVHMGYDIEIGVIKLRMYKNVLYVSKNEHNNLERRQLNESSD